MAVRLSASRIGRALLQRKVSVSDTHFCYKLSKAQGLVRLESVDKLINFNYLIGCGTPPDFVA
jgi:hypothetical protein